MSFVDTPQYARHTRMFELLRVDRQAKAVIRRKAEVQDDEAALEAFQAIALGSFNQPVPDPSPA